jgi:hypothetical protein
MTLDGASTSPHQHMHQVISQSEPKGQRWWQQVLLKCMPMYLPDYMMSHSTQVYYSNVLRTSNIIYTANFLATRFQSPYSSELPEITNLISLFCCYFMPKINPNVTFSVAFPRCGEGLLDRFSTRGGEPRLVTSNIIL